MNEKAFVLHLLNLFFITYKNYGYKEIFFNKLLLNFKLFDSVFVDCKSQKVLSNL